jgi:hypothetical protein
MEVGISAKVRHLHLMDTVPFRAMRSASGVGWPEIRAHAQRLDVDKLDAFVRDSDLLFAPRHLANEAPGATGDRQLRRHSRITAPTRRRGPDGIVPLRMPGICLDVQRRHFSVGDLDALGIAVLIQLALYCQAGFGGRRSRSTRRTVGKPDKVHFLGFRFRCTTGREDDDVAIHPSAKAERRLRTALREMTRPNWGRSLRPVWTTSAVTRVGGCSTTGSARRKRCKDWGCHRFLARVLARPYPSPGQGDRRPTKEAATFPLPLKAKGVSSKAAASCAYCGKGAWVKSNRQAMTRAYPPRWLTGRMAPLEARWHDLNPPQGLGPARAGILTYPIQGAVCVTCTYGSVRGTGK